jgi:hypothetical protein
VAEEPDVPFWVKGRQATVEPVGQDMYRVSGPNLPEAIVGVRTTDDGCWRGYIRANADGRDIAVMPTTNDNSHDALFAAFELYREHMIY